MNQVSTASKTYGFITLASVDNELVRCVTKFDKNRARVNTVKRASSYTIFFPLFVFATTTQNS